MILKEFSIIFQGINDSEICDSFMDALMKGFNQICTFPESGEVLDNKFVPTDMIRRVLIGRYVIFYLIMKGQKENSDIEGIS